MTPVKQRCETCNKLWKDTCPYYAWIENGNIGISCESYIEFTSIVGCASYVTKEVSVIRRDADKYEITGGQMHEIADIVDEHVSSNDKKREFYKIYRDVGSHPLNKQFINDIRIALESLPPDEDCVGEMNSDECKSYENGCTLCRFDHAIRSVRIKEKS